MEVADFDRWYAASFPRLVGQLAVLIGDREEAADCVQEAFVRAWDRRLEPAAVVSGDAWIRTTAHRLAVSRWRRLRRGLHLAGTRLPATAGVLPELSADHIDLAAALAKLPLGQRQCIVLHYLADLTVAQVAAELGLPDGTVKARLHRARATLADLLDDPAATTGGAR